MNRHFIDNYIDGKEGQEKIFTMREIKVKAMMIFHYSLTGKTKIQNTGKTKILVRMWRNQITQPCCWDGKRHRDSYTCLGNFL